jgi:pyrimidine deaminase RibD-like protein
MTAKRLLTILTAAGFVFVTLAPCVHAQKTPKSLTIIYSNNINGELDPCPT